MSTYKHMRQKEIEQARAKMFARQLFIDQVNAEIREQEDVTGPYEIKMQIVLRLLGSGRFYDTVHDDEIDEFIEWYFGRRCFESKAS